MAGDDRIFDDEGPAATAFVATDAGAVAVALVGDRIDTFELASRGETVDVARVGDRIALAGEDVRLGDADGFESTDFGPATAVGGRPLLAASPGGAIGQWDDNEWTAIGDLDATVRAIDGDLLATDAGVYRLTGDDLVEAGLADVRDVATAGVPHAASSSGLYRLGAGWMREREGAFDVVAVDAADASLARIGRAVAATETTLYEHVDGEWRAESLPVDEPVADVAFGAVPVAVTRGGTVLTRGEEGWRARSLGVDRAYGLAVLPDRNA